LKATRNLRRRPCADHHRMTVSLAMLLGGLDRLTLKPGMVLTLASFAQLLGCDLIVAPSRRSNSAWDR
jgi:hypothetical protein